MQKFTFSDIFFVFPIIKRNRLTAFLLFCLITTNTLSQEADSTQADKFIITFEFNENPTIFNALERYHLIMDLTKNNRVNKLNQDAYNYLSQQTQPGLSFNETYNLLQNSDLFMVSRASKLELSYAVWRAKLINIKHDNELPEIMDYGLNNLISEGYTDLSKHVFPFISMLMAEHKKYYYDHSRTKAFGQEARGVYTVTRMFSTFKVPGRTAVLGVCRDIHDVGLRMIRELTTNYYSQLYPNLKINMDDYIFLTSWVTQDSQHITISYIDPLKPETIYELDWGRLIKKIDNYGYEHGRNYGNVYRVWHFNSEKNISIPIDYKKTMIGNIFADQAYNAAETDAFCGIKNAEPYSAMKLYSLPNKQINWQLSAGSMALSQKFVLSGLSHRSKEINIAKGISFRGAASLQAMLLEESKKKNVMFPRYHYTSSRAVLVLPRYTASFKLFEMQISEKIQSSFQLHNSIEILFHANRSVTDAVENPREINTAGDGGIYTTQAYHISYNNKDFKSKLILQNRSFLIPKDVRLMSPNPFEMVGSAKIVSPARDIILNTEYSGTGSFGFETKTVLEFTNMDNILFYGRLDAQQRIRPLGYVYLGMSLYRNLKGFPYFWYPINRELLHFGISDLSQRLKAVVFLQNTGNEFTKGIKLQYGF